MTKTKDNNNIAKDSFTKIKNWWNNLRLGDKRLIFLFIGLLIILILVNMTISTWTYEHKKITYEQCYNLELAKDYPQWYNILNYPLIKILVFAVAIGWVLHGIQFRILA